MKKALLLTLVLLCCASLAFAQMYPLLGGEIGVYGDSQGASCEISRSASGIVRFFFFHLASSGTTGSEFKLDLTGFAYSIWLGDQSPFALWTGHFHQGKSIAYQDCLFNNIYLGVASFLSTGTAPTCCRVYVKNHPLPSIPGATTPIAIGCPSGYLALRGSYAIVSQYFTNCPCRGTVPTEETSWGQIKALYE